jgi:YbbR domain-containing protein
MMAVSKKMRKHLLKVFSVAFSFFLWLYVLSSAQIQVEKSVKINYVLPSRMAINNNVTTEVHYTLKGPRAFVRSLVTRSDILNVDLNDKFVPGKKQYTIPVKTLGMTFPFGIEIVKVEPRKLQVELERKYDKVVPIKLETLGQIPSDHKMLTSFIEPKEMTISGPESQLKNITQIETFPIELNGLTGVGERNVGLVQNDARIYIPFNEVKFKYNIKPTRANLILKNIPIHFFTSKMVTSVNRREVNLMVLADKGQDTKISKSKIRVIAEVPEDISGNTVVKLRAELPDGIHLLEIQPAKIELTVK